MQKSDCASTVIFIWGEEIPPEWGWFSFQAALQCCSGASISFFGFCCSSLQMLLFWHVSPLILLSVSAVILNPIGSLVNCLQLFLSLSRFPAPVLKSFLSSSLSLYLERRELESFVLFFFLHLFSLFCIHKEVLGNQNSLGFLVFMKTCQNGGCTKWSCSFKKNVVVVGEFQNVLQNDITGDSQAYHVHSENFCFYFQLC